jgi:hypothetical protein
MCQIPNVVVLLIGSQSTIIKLLERAEHNLITSLLSYFHKPYLHKI